MKGTLRPVDKVQKCLLLLVLPPCCAEFLAYCVDGCFRSHLWDSLFLWPFLIDGFAVFIFSRIKYKTNVSLHDTFGLREICWYHTFLHRHRNVMDVILFIFQSWLHWVLGLIIICVKVYYSYWYSGTAQCYSSAWMWLYDVQAEEMQTRALTADDFITEIQFLQSRATHYWRKAVEKLDKLERSAFHWILSLLIPHSLLEKSSVYHVVFSTYVFIWNHVPSLLLILKVARSYLTVTQCC